MTAKEVLEKPYDVNTVTTAELYQRKIAGWWLREGQKEKDCFLIYMMTLISEYQQEGIYEIVDVLKRVRAIGSAWEPKFHEEE